MNKTVQKWSCVRCNSMERPYYITEEIRQCRDCEYYGPLSEFQA